MIIPRLSIITPCLNQAELLVGCLRHVASLGPQVEHIVVDDTSTDASVQLLETAQLANPQRMRFVSRPDSNLYEAVNTGLEMARAEICTYLNCDDLLLPWAVGAMLDFFVREPRTELLVADAIEWLPSEGRAALVVHPPAPLLQTYLRNDGHLAQPAVFFRRSLVSRLGGFSTDYRLLGDHDLWLRWLEYGAVVKRLWEFVAVQRMSPGQLMAQHAELAVEERAQIRRAHDLRLSSRWSRGAARVGYAVLHRTAMLTTWSTAQISSTATLPALPWSLSAGSRGLKFTSVTQVLRAILGSSVGQRYLALDLAALNLDPDVDRPEE